MTLREIGLKHGTDKATAHHYCDFYEQELKGFSPKRILEIGVKDGASLKMWREFYPAADIIGIDINPPVKVPGCTVFQMDGTDIYALIGLGRFDLIIDDGSHMTKDQQISFEYLFNNRLNRGGFYIVEDVHTSFHSEYINSEYTTYEMLKHLGKLFQRIPGDTSDSNTILIKK